MLSVYVDDFKIVGYKTELTIGMEVAQARVAYRTGEAYR